MIGEQIPIKIGIMAGYNEPAIFYTNIAKSGDEAEAMESWQMLKTKK